MTNLAIDAHGLRKVFGNKIAVDDLTLQVERGEVFGFLGPNGAGKTTSIKMMIGLIQPTAGSAELLGRPMGDRTTRFKIGYLPEHFRFYEWLQADEFLDLHGRLYGMDRATRQTVIPDLLELVGLEKRIHTRLRAFSKGMMQRIGLAQALLNSPDLIFLDEPTSGLDPVGRLLVRDIIHDLREEGTAIFLNSHLLGEVEKTCDRVAFIRDGNILEVHRLDDLNREAIQVTLRVGQPTPDLLAHLTDFGNNPHFNGNNDHIKLTIHNEENIPALVNWLVTNGHTLYELSPYRLSLEDRFLQIIGEYSGDT